MATITERAILAGGCFWVLQELVRALPGRLSTRVGYTGGDLTNATYRDRGTHAEAIEIIFDPSQTSLRDHAGVLLPDPRSDHAEPARQRPRRELRLCDLLRHEERRRITQDAIADVDASGCGRARW